MAQALGNLALCNCDPIAARDLTLPEYDALIKGWNLIHESDGDTMPPPSAEKWEAEQARLRNSPVTKATPSKGNRATPARAE